MKIQGADLRETNRIPLQDAVPLDAPLSVYLEPTNLCNVRCAFCPTGDHALIRSIGRPQGAMTREIFDNVVENLQVFGKIKHCNFFKDGEVLVNRNFPEMARALRPYCEKLWTATNGLLLNHEMNKRITAAQFDMIRISVIAPHAAGYKRIANTDMDYYTFWSNVDNLFEMRGNTKIYIKMADVDFDASEIQKFYDDWSPVSDFIAIENLHGWSRTDLKDFTLGHTDNKTFDGVPNVERVACAWPFYQMAINWNGTVQPCNEDWSWNNIMGDINEQSLWDIWHGDKFNEFRKMQLRGERGGNKACGNCWQTMSCVDNVDPYRQQILERMEA